MSENSGKPFGCKDINRADLQYAQAARSPFDISGLDLNFNAREILDVIRESRQSPNFPQVLVKKSVEVTSMATVKERIFEIVDSQPEDSSYDDILSELALARMVERGLDDSRQERIISNVEMARRIQEWQK